MATNRHNRPTRCVDGRLMRHDPQPDDPGLETDIGKCPECEGDGCDKERYLDIVFDGPPSHEAGRFVEVENDMGRSVRLGEWIKRPGGYWVLRFTATEVAELVG